MRALKARSSYCQQMQTRALEGLVIANPTNTSGLERPMQKVSLGA